MGQTYTIIKNLTNKKLFLSWFPLGEGRYGLFLNPREQMRYSGNLIEEIWGFIDKKEALSKDVSSGKILITVCGGRDYPYSVFDLNTAPEFKQWGCVVWNYDSSSAAWIGT